MGEVNLTCDAWQASNTEGYFAVTGHWIEVSIPAQWELKSALLGFTCVSNAHNGKRLGQVLFKVLVRVGIEHKVCEPNFTPLSVPKVLIRLAMLPVTMHPTTQQCFVRWPLASRLKQGRYITGDQGK